MHHKITRSISGAAKLLVFIMVIGVVFYSSPTAEAADWNWTEDRSMRSYSYFGMTFNDKDFYVLTGIDGAIFTSTDFSNWTYRESGTRNSLHGCAWGNGTFVAAGYDGTIARSQDGLNWTSFQLPDNIDFLDVTWADGKFMAVGIIFPTNNRTDTRYIYTSPDGLKWEKVLAYTAGSLWSDIRYLNGRTIVFGLADDFAVSSDGLKWENAALPDGEEIRDIIWDGAQYVCIGSKTSIYTSANALDWTKLSSNLKAGPCSANLAYFNGLYIMDLDASAGNGMTVSKNLTEWSPIQSRPWSDLERLLVNKDKLVAYLRNSTVLSSSDVSHWKISSSYSPNLLKLIWNGSRFLAIANNGEVLLSPDGIQWSKNTTEIEPSLMDVVWTGSEYTALACTFDQSGYNVLHTDIYKSSNGTNWTRLSSVSTEGMRKMYYFNDRYFLLGLNGKILYSDDAINWKQANSGTDKWLRGLAWNGSQYVCVGMFGTLLTSIDGHTWTSQKHFTNDDINSVLWNGTQYVAVGGGNTIAVSTDGVTWQRTSEYKDYTFTDVLWDGSRYVFLQQMGEIKISNDARLLSTVSSHTTSTPNSLAWNGERYVLVGGSSSICTFKPNDIIKVKINNIPIAFDVAPQIINGRTMIPARAVLEKLGAALTWDAQTRTIQVANGQTNIILTIGSNKAIVNGREVTLDVPATIIDNRTLLPLRFLAENLGASVSWDQDTRTIDIR